jgi:hypothetical protein
VTHHFLSRHHAQHAKAEKIIAGTSIGATACACARYAPQEKQRWLPRSQ